MVAAEVGDHPRMLAAHRRCGSTDDVTGRTASGTACLERDRLQITEGPPACRRCRGVVAQLEIGTTATRVIDVLSRERGVPGLWPDYVFNSMSGVLPGDAVGVLEHELMEVKVSTGTRRPTVGPIRATR